MSNHIKLAAIVIISIFNLLTLTACQTVQGLGKDIQSIGSPGQEQSTTVVERTYVVHD